MFYFEGDALGKTGFSLFLIANPPPALRRKVVLTTEEMLSKSRKIKQKLSLLAAVPMAE